MAFQMITLFMSDDSCLISAILNHDDNHEIHSESVQVIVYSIFKIPGIRLIAGKAI